MSINNTRLRELRTEKRLTLRELSELMNISYSNIAMIERGERNLTSDNLKAFCDFFNVSSDYLLGISDSRNPIVTSPSAKEQLKGVKLALYNKTDELTEEQAKDVLKYIEFLKSKGEID